MSADRYLRQTIFAGLGRQGQERLRSATVAIIGLGATGSSIAQTLARAGVGALRIADRDILELHNLQRQTLYDEQDLDGGQPKAIAAAARLRAINSEIAVTPFAVDVSGETIAEVAGQAQLLLDGSDSFETRYLINEYCVERQLPWIYSGVVASYAMSMTLLPGAACFRCIFPQAPAPGMAPTCDTAGVLGGAAAAIGAIAATEAIKLISGAGRLNDGLLHMDLWELNFDLLPVGPRQPGCPSCGTGDREYLRGEAGSRTTLLCGRNTIQVRPAQSGPLDLDQLARRLRQAGVEQLRANEHLCAFRSGDYALTIFADGRALIKGTEDSALARSLYTRWVGM